MYVFEWYPFIYPGGAFRDDFFTRWEQLTRQLDTGARFAWGAMRFDLVATVDGPVARAQRDSAVATHRDNRNMLAMWRGVPYRNSVDSVSGKPIHLECGPATYLDRINTSGVAVYGLAGWFDAWTRLNDFSLVQRTRAFRGSRLHRYRSDFGLQEHVSG